MKRAGLLLLVLAGCLPGRFDDLESSLWIDQTTRDDAMITGDFALSVTAVRPSNVACQ